MDSYDEYGNYIGEELQDSEVEEEGDDDVAPAAAAPSRAYDEDTVLNGDDLDQDGMEIDGEQLSEPPLLHHRDPSNLGQRKKTNRD